MKKVLVFGTFDILHEGHKFLFKKAKALGDRLIVIVACDETVRKVKGKMPVNDEKKRLGQVRKIPEVDEAFLGRKGKDEDKYFVIKDYAPDVICLGYDQAFLTEGIKSKIKEFGLKAEVVRLPAFMPEKYKSSLLRSAKGT